MLSKLNRSSYGAGILILICLVLSCAPTSSYLAKPIASAESEGSSTEATYHYSLGVLSLLSGNVGNAIREYETALTYDPRSGLLAAELASLYMKTGQHQKAIELCEKSLEVNPGYVDCTFSWALFTWKKRTSQMRKSNFRKQ